MEHLEHSLEHKKFRKNSGEVVSPFSFAHKFAHFHYIYRGGGLSVGLASLRIMRGRGRGRIMRGRGRIWGVYGAYMGRKLFTMRLHIVVYMRKRGGALFCGVYIWRFYRGKWAIFEECSQNRLTCFIFSCILGACLINASVNIKTR